LKTGRRYCRRKKKTMANVDVVNLNGEKVGTLELSDALFGPDQVNEALLWEAVKHYRASLRQGTAATKSRTEVAGSGKKLWKQKGTGRARIGSVRSPIWRHGGTVHGPQPRDYSYRMPRKMLLGALRSALSAKVRDGELKVVQAFSFADHKTKQAMNALATLEAGRTVLVVDNSGDRNLALGVRNLEGVTLMPTRDVNPYHLLGHKSVLLSEAAARKFSEALAK
jgi:large subunit ribosomal protein L4